MSKGRLLQAFTLLRKSNTVTNRNDERLIKWSFPLSGCIKINTDGSSSADNCRGSFGGIVRSKQDKWVEGFCRYTGYANWLKAE